MSTELSPEEEWCTDYHCAGDCGKRGSGYQHGEGQQSPDYWQEEARRFAQNADYWRNRAEAGQSSTQAEEALRRLHDWGGFLGYSGGKWSGTIVCDVMDWFVGGMKGPLPPLPEWAKEGRDHG